jgi:hypothetical protein
LRDLIVRAIAASSSVSGFAWGGALRHESANILLYTSHPSQSQEEPKRMDSYGQTEGEFASDWL